MINEALIQSIVRNVVTRLEREIPAESQDSPDPCSALPTLEPEQTVGTLHQNYRARYLGSSPFEERFSLEFASSLPVELGRPLVCIYERHQPCDSCGRCEVRGF
jgi:hypothetical protein